MQNSNAPLLALGPVLAAAILLAGCHAGPPAGVPRLEAYGPDGRGPTADQLAALAKSNPGGLVIEYQAGDRIAVELAVEGGLFRAETPGEVVLTAVEPVEVWMGSRGIMMRIDGGPWRPWLDAVDGELSVGLSFRDGDGVNRASVAVIAGPAE